MGPRKSLEDQLGEAFADRISVMPILCPVIFLAGLSVLFMMRGDTAHEWHTIWQKEDISITFRENYYASIFLFGIPMAILILCVHLGVNKLNEQRGNILYSPTVSWVFHGLVFFSIFGLMGLLIFPQTETGTWKDKAHLQLTYTMFVASLFYQIFNSVCLARFVYAEKRRQTLLNFSCILYFVFLTTAALYSVLKWRANQYYVEDDEGIRHLVARRLTMNGSLCFAWFCAIWAFVHIEPSLQWKRSSTNVKSP